jgi:predicted nucleic-acid-binding protein
MREKSGKLRALIYSLISNIRCQLEKDFKIVIENILNNLKLFKEDKLLVFQAIKMFSKNNCSFINTEYINAILDIDPVNIYYNSL